jgi:hypothetical protein
MSLPESSTGHQVEKPSKSERLEARLSREQFDRSVGWVKE